ncbi:MAG: type I restriction endonuclease subunit R, partial [Anaerolineae bacterium]
GYAIHYGPDIAPGETHAARESYAEVVLQSRLRAALRRFNTHIPQEAQIAVFNEVVRKVTQVPGPNALTANHTFHRWLVEGVDVTFHVKGKPRHDKVWLVDFEEPRRNYWLAVNQFTVTGVNRTTHARTHRRPDIVIFVNGMPLAVIELKNPADENATLKSAFNQLQTYKADIGDLLTYNEALVIADGTEARMGTLTSGWEWFKPWRLPEDEDRPSSQAEPQLGVLLRGVFERAHFLDLIRFFTVFQIDGPRIEKKTALYHQYYAVNKAVESTVEAASRAGDQRAGVIWHTQGSGKSLSMLFYAGKIIQRPEMANPTLVVLTDRNDLDDQLFDTFATGQELLRQAPRQAASRDHLKELLRVASGGVIFTTIQKFWPEDRSGEYELLSERRNIVFIADEAHRSQYGFDAHVVEHEDEAYVSYGFAKYVRDALPNASFIGFTGTPIEATDVNTPRVFGDYIDIYDIHRSIKDGATVPIYYEARLAKLRLDDARRPQIDLDFEAITEGEALPGRERLKSRWSRLEAMVGTEQRLERVAADIVRHFEQRQEVMEGKAMIVCMSRRIAVELYKQLIKLRPAWHSPRDDEGVLKVVMTGSAGDPEDYQIHLRNKRRRKALAERFKDPDDNFKIAIVCDMWLTGFDVPSLHTMYVDKPMHGHTLMQAIARVNRVYKDKPGGLIVDYLGIATYLKEAMAHYTRAGHGELPAQAQDQAVALMRTEYETVKALLHDFDYSAFHDGTPVQRLSVIPAAMEHVLQQKDGKERFVEAVTRLSKAFALAMPADEAVAIRDDVAFFQAVRSSFVKATTAQGKSRGEMDSAIKQLVSGAVTSPGVINIFEAAGLETPDVSILSDEFLNEVKRLPHRNLALELLRKLLNDEIQAHRGKNVVQARSFEEMLQRSIKRYQNRTINAAEVITELIELAREMRAAQKRGETLGLTEEEVAFYDALAANESAVEVMGNKELAFIAHELVKAVRQNVSIDWTVRKSSRAKIRIAVKRILRRHGYPPDLQAQATDTVLEQAELFASSWA